MLKLETGMAPVADVSCQYISLTYRRVLYCRTIAMDVFRALKLHKLIIIIIIIIIITIILYERASIFKSTSAVGVKV